MSAKTLKTSSASGTAKLGFRLARQITRNKPACVAEATSAWLRRSVATLRRARRRPGKQAAVIALTGELGSGKTTFLQGFAKGLGIKEKVLSPTFVIMKRFKIQDSRFKILYHFDCYRLENARDLYGLGWKEIIKDPKAIIVVEWADRVRKAIPKDAIWVEFRFLEEHEREINTGVTYLG